MTPTPPPPRLAMVQASRAPVAVIFRRGPSKAVEIIRWDLSRDSFERGHWFHGRIYEKRSDLSPDGELLVYFASRFDRSADEAGEYTYAWTAVSRAPWLTALALWPKGNCWWGGGLFLDRRTLLLNHRPDEASPHPRHRPEGLTVHANPDAEGEDDPLYSRRLDRDGWILRHEWEIERTTPRGGFRTLTPAVRAKHQPGATDGAERISILLERRLDGWRVSSRFRMEGTATQVEFPPGPVEWVDWDPRGRVVALAGGRVWAAGVEEGRVERFRELLDLRGDRPEPRAAPDSACRW